VRDSHDDGTLKAVLQEFLVYDVLALKSVYDVLALNS